MQGEDSGVLEQKVLEALLTKRAPGLARSCTQLGLSCSELTQSWFPCLFAATLPAEATARVWDALLVEGPKVLFRVGLALFKVCTWKSPFLCVPAPVHGHVRVHLAAIG